MRNPGFSGLVTRPARAADAHAWGRLRQALWPGETNEHEEEIARFFAGLANEPQAVILAEREGEILGFAELSLRVYAEGCSSSPVGYLEGWYVVPEARRQGVGRALVRAAEAWAKERGCTEFASDTELENTRSAAAHRALGFEEVEIIRCFRKPLTMRTEPTPKTLLETERLTLRPLTTDDAELILELLNEPAFLQYIGDRGVRTIEDARQYILNGPLASYEQHGFGPYRVALKETDVPIGMCGLFKRDSLEDPDVGFAFLSRFRANGYAFESASAVLTYGREVLGLPRIVAFTAPDNEASIRLLGKLGLTFAGMIRLTGEDSESRLFTTDPR